MWEHQSYLCIMVQANIRSSWAPEKEFTQGSVTVGRRLTSQIKKNATEMCVYFLMHKFFERPPYQKIAFWMNVPSPLSQSMSVKDLLRHGEKR